MAVSAGMPHDVPGQLEKSSAELGRARASGPVFHCERKCGQGRGGCVDGHPAPGHVEAALPCASSPPLRDGGHVLSLSPPRGHVLLSTRSPPRGGLGSRMQGVVSTATGWGGRERGGLNTHGARGSDHGDRSWGPLTGRETCQGSLLYHTFYGQGTELGEGEELGRVPQLKEKQDVKPWRLAPAVELQVHVFSAGTGGSREAVGAPRSPQNQRSLREHTVGYRSAAGWFWGSGIIQGLG